MKILIAEDDPHIRAGIVEIFEDEGYTPLEASDGIEAIELFEKKSPDFVILDIMMPRCNGYDVCRAIRKKNTQVPVIFLSAKSEEIDKVLGLELGADDYISKPFGVKELVARVRALLRRVQIPAPTSDPSNPITTPPFTMQDLQILPDALRAKREEQEIELSLRDLQILTLLHQQQGKVVDRNTLFDICWGIHYAPNSRTLDQHISQLRKKVELDPRSPTIIRTVHGVGYRYDP
ncbi:MAG: response regulator transcription factor [Myxococcales bacterium]|nr:response regulator transcription factor [Myxococcales bacterium]